MNARKKKKKKLFGRSFFSRPLAFTLATQTAQKKRFKKKEIGGGWVNITKNIRKRTYTKENPIWEEEATKFKPYLLSNRPKEEYSFKVLVIRENPKELRNLEEEIRET